ncbi:MAG TPA: toll/interleukin-1 receptor domain-containing protein [Bryobacteraceae bacterium]|nr:toll/interleukin-1 receptor domain-containing protein [Bryobacteraceae bacterium]
MADVFISYVEQDGEIARLIAANLESAGFSTWYYERDSVPGVSYLLQTGSAIESAKAVLVLISSQSLSSVQVTREVVRAHESAKHFLPVLVDVSHTEFQTRQPEWREAIGAATSVSISHRGIDVASQALQRGLLSLGVTPGSARFDKPSAPAAFIQPRAQRRSRLPLWIGIGAGVAVLAIVLGQRPAPVPKDQSPPQTSANGADITPANPPARPSSRPAPPPDVNRTACVFDPVSNIRERPSAASEILCKIETTRNIRITGRPSITNTGVWWPTDACGAAGFIAANQVHVDVPSCP